MKNISLFTKGLIIGTGKIIPGVSGAVMAILFGLYEPIITMLSSVKGFKENVSKLKFVLLGIFISVIFGSNLIKYFYTSYYDKTMFLFLGMMFSSLISFKKELNFKKINYKYFLYVGLFVLIFISILNFPFVKVNNITSSFHFSLEVFASGMIEAFSSIVPGISGTAILIYIDYYDVVLNILSNPFSNILFSFLFLFGIGLGIILFSKLINILFKFYKNETKILAFILSTTTILLLFINIMHLVSFDNIFSLIIFFLLGYILTNILQSKIGNNC